MANIPKLLASVRGGKYNARQLQALLSNQNKDATVSDEDREEMVDSVELALREHYPKEARKILGSVDARPIEVLEEIYADVQSNFDLSGNRVKNGVKAGGSMRSGDAVLDWHISYKDIEGNGVVIGAYQWGSRDPLKYKVFKYKKANKPGSTYDEIEYLAESPEISLTYKRMLSELLASDE